MDIIVIYDDTVPKSELITDIIGNKGFSDVVVKKQHLEDYAYNEIRKLYKNVIWKKIRFVAEFSKLVSYIKELYNNDDIKILHCFSNYLIKDSEKVLLSYEKLLYIEEPYTYTHNKKLAGIMFSNAKSYLQYCKNILAGQTPAEATAYIKNSFEVDGFMDLSEINNFIQCITGAFDARYFNSLSQDNEYTITKTSTDKLKIKKEYTYYQLLPEDMKSWFVIPFCYKEEKNTASYTMERLHMTDLAIKYVHSSISEDEFNSILDKYFYFFKTRHSRPCTVEDYNKISKSLYEDKINTRINDLKKHSEYTNIEKLLNACGSSIDELVEKYFALKYKIEKQNNYPKFDVIGHGDPGFANTLYNKATQTLKFIDPKGALEENDLWTNPYYDIAKLSHCVCGRYDFFNNGLFEIKINDKFECDLEIPFDNDKYKKIFKQKVQENGFNYDSVRIYEASLFLSMLPLHIDNPFKVLGFILNVKNILEEIEKDV